MEFVFSYRPIVDYIDTQFENYLQEELKIRRSLFNYHDTRIHVCLYFITPTGHSLKSLDLVTMKKLDSKVSIPTSSQVLVLIFVYLSPFLLIINLNDALGQEFSFSRLKA